MKADDEKAANLSNDENSSQNVENGNVTILDDATKAKSPVSQLILADPLNNYFPTRKEQDLLHILLDPFHRMTSITKVCEMAGVSRQTYYEMFRKPEFQAYYRHALLEVVKQYGGQLVNIGIREARKGSFPHWKVLMEMGGFYGEKKDINVEGGMTMKVVFVDPDDPE